MALRAELAASHEEACNHKAQPKDPPISHPRKRYQTILRNARARWHVVL